MKRTETLRQMSNEQLQNRLKGIHISLVRFGQYSKCLPRSANGRGQNTMVWKSLKKEKARILTILTERKTRKQ